MAKKKSKEVFLVDFKSTNSSETFTGTYVDIMSALAEYKKNNSWGTATMLTMSVLQVVKDELDPVSCQLIETTSSFTTTLKYDAPVDELNAFITLLQKSYHFLDTV
jgi:hypothetical protein